MSTPRRKRVEASSETIDDREIEIAELKEQMDQMEVAKVLVKSTPNIKAELQRLVNEYPLCQSHEMRYLFEKWMPQLDQWVAKVKALANS